MEKQENTSGTSKINTASSISETGRTLSYSPPPSPAQLPKRTRSWWSFLKFRWFTAPFS